MCEFKVSLGCMARSCLTNVLLTLCVSLLKVLAILCCREAWKALGNSSRNQAMQEYITAVKKLDPGWNPQVRLRR